MKITREKVIEPAIPAVVETEEIEITFPSYYKYVENDRWISYYKLISEHEGIVVTHIEGRPYSIRHDVQQVVTCNAVDNAMRGVEITEEEFTEKFNEVMKSINDALISNALRLTAEMRD